MSELPGRRRRRSARAPDALPDRWSFGGAGSIETAAGALRPGALLAGPDHAFLDMSMLPPDALRDRFAAPARTASDRENRAAAAHAAHAALTASVETALGEVIAVDERGNGYTLRPLVFSGPSGRDRGLLSMRLSLDPVPSRECGWIELRGRDGSKTRLTRSARPAVRVREVAPAPGGPERELSEQALGVIRALLTGAGREAVERACSAALGRAAEMRASGELDSGSEVSRQLARLCASVTGHGPLAGVPRGWSGMVSAAERADGAPHHLDIATDLPRAGSTAVRVDSLVSEPGSWRVYLRARPGWWTYSDDGQHKWAAMSVHAGDDIGGRYLSEFGGSTSHGDHEEVTLRFRPRLDPLARALTLAFAAAGNQVAVELRVGPAPRG